MQVSQVQKAHPFIWCMHFLMVLNWSWCYAVILFIMFALFPYASNIENFSTVHADMLKICQDHLS